MGVQLDQHLAWDEYVRFVCVKVSHALGFLKHVKKFLHQETLSHIYRGIVEPYFRYCSSVWGSCGETRFLTLQKLQNRATRIVTNSSYDAPADALIEKFNWPTIADIIKRETANLVYSDVSLKYISRNSILDTVYLRNSETKLASASIQKVPLFCSWAELAGISWGSSLEQPRLEKHPLYLYLTSTLIFFFSYVNFLLF